MRVYLPAVHVLGYEAILAFDEPESLFPVRMLSAANDAGYRVKGFPRHVGPSGRQICLKHGEELTRIMQGERAHDVHEMQDEFGKTRYCFGYRSAENPFGEDGWSMST